jgi:twitching motility protein PilT
MDYKKYLFYLLDLALKDDSVSDIHLVANYKPFFRKNGKLFELEEEQILTPEMTENFAFTMMQEEQKEKFLKEKDIDFSFTFENKTRFRVNVFFQKGNISLALRLVYPRIRTIEELNLPSILHKFAQANQGLILITGASSQGKSTTLAALIDEINHSRCEHIITIEDPIEYIFVPDKSLIEQREIYYDALSFKRALRATLREDPNVIMVGELRDLETISTALTAAETGHLVLATLHTNSADQTIHRIVDVFPAIHQNQIRAQLAGALFGVVAQRLVPSLDGGFFPACEVMFNNSAISNLIRENKIHEIPAIIETSAESGMMTLNKSLVDLVKAKKISKETAINYSLNQKDLISRLMTFKI